MMDSKAQSKSTRRRKKASRTEGMHKLRFRFKRNANPIDVLSDSEMELDIQQQVKSPAVIVAASVQEPKPARSTIISNHDSHEIPEGDASAAFNAYYMHKVTMEFADDLDKIRGTDDFSDAALPLLINALRTGSSLFSVEEQNRVATAAKKG